MRIIIPGNDPGAAGHGGRRAGEEQAGAEAAALAGRLLRAMPRLQQWAAASLRASRAEGDPSFRQLAVLYLVQTGIASPALLADHLGSSRAVVTGLLDRMEERGLVRREPDPGDRRRLRVVATPEGIAAGERLGSVVAGRLAAHLARERESDLAALAAALAGRP
ncbi:MAG: MarR family transcriptional regulator [Chloroflexota bacterium]